MVVFSILIESHEPGVLIGAPRAAAVGVFRSTFITMIPTKLLYVIYICQCIGQSMKARKTYFDRVLFFISFYILRWVKLFKSLLV